MATGVASIDFGNTTSSWVAIHAASGPYDDITTYPLTVGLWINVQDTSNDNRIFYFGRTDTGTRWFLIWNETTPTFDVMERGTGTSANAKASFSQDTWYWLVGVFESGSSRKIYLDGSLIDTNTNSEDAFADGDLQSACLGRTDDSSPTSDCQAYLAYPVMYDRILSIEEINEIMWKPYSIINGLVWAPNLLNSISVASDCKDLSGLGYDCDTIGNAPATSSLGPSVFFSGGQ